MRLLPIVSMLWICSGLLAACTTPAPAGHGMQERGGMSCMNGAAKPAGSAAAADADAQASAHAGHGAAGSAASSPAGAASGPASHCAMMKRA